MSEKNKDLPELVVLKRWLEDKDIEVELRSHKAAEELDGTEDVPPELLLLVPSHQLIATSLMGEISVIHSGCSQNQFEICCLKGDLFSDIRRYKTAEDAGQNILKLLNEGLFDEDIKRCFDVFNDFLNPDPEGSIQEVDYSELEEDE